MESLFKLSEKGTSVKVELRAGLATFLTMAYIIVVNPDILSATGMSFSGVLFATVLVSAVSSILMGLVANLPFALAPGMGINALFSYTIVLGMGVAWQTALGAVFISGIAFILLSVFKVREAIVRAIPTSLRYGVAAGIGLFLALIGLTNVGFIIPDAGTPVAFGGLNEQTILFIVGLAITSILVVRKVRGALIYGIVGTSIIALITSLIVEATGGEAFMSVPDRIFALPTFEVFFKLDILG
ncbi:MAG: solute carrier family 23 protein, partial [Spirochaetota bacterium]